MEATDLFALQGAEPVVLVSGEAEPVERAVASPGLRRMVLGVDPGSSGAIAFYDPSRPREIQVHDVPVVDGEIDAATLAHLIREAGVTEAIIEKVGAMPKQGVSSTFKFGTAYGAVQGVVGALAIPYRRVTPGRWKGHFRLSSDKEQARGLAARTWPASRDFARKKDHGRAEAALLALWGCEVVR